LSLSLRLLGRDWRAGELRLLIVAILVAVGTVTAISLFVDRLQRALLSESSNFLAADRIITSSRAIPEAFVAAAQALGIQTTQTLTFPSMVFAGDESQLVSVKAVAPGYPLRGTLITSDAPFVRGQPTDELPAPGEVWLDARLFPSLDLRLGDTVAVGVLDLTVAKVLAAEPDRGGSFFDLGPRLLMRLADVPATEVVQPGSRIGYRLLLGGDEAVLADLKSRLSDALDPHYRWRSIRESSPSIGSALDRAERFLLLGGLLAVLLAGVAVALGAHRFAARHYDHVAIFKTLGATPTEVQWGYLTALAALTVVGVLAGLLVGVGLHLGVVAVLRTYLPVELPLPGAKPFLVGTVTGFVCVATFALPPILALKGVSPMRVIRRDFERAGLSRSVTYAVAAAGSLGLLVWYSQSWWLTFWTLTGVLGIAVVFAAMAFGLLSAGRVLGMQAGNYWRLALAGLARRRGESVAQILIFALAIMLLLILVLLRTALLDEWQTQVPERAPNHFLMNVAPDEVGALSALLDANVEFDGRLFPLIRGRIIAVNDEDAQSFQERHRSPDAPGPRLESERNLSWTNALPADNRILEGEWWAPGEERKLASLEEEYARETGLGVGDRLLVDIGGLTVEVLVTSIRRVEWDNMQPNFFVLFSESALRDFPSTFMTSFYLPPENKLFLNELLSRFRTVTVIEVDEIVKQIRSIIGRVTQAVELVLGLVLASGCLVLVASIQASRDQRMAEHALLRTLGAPRALIRGALAAEFALLGAFAGIVATIGAEVTVFALQTEIFELNYDLHPWLWGVGPAIGIVVIALVGVLGTQRLVNTPPMAVLRELD
jgi:putative ABC transport system permease protein